jgi:hypothetical protein
MVAVPWHRYPLRGDSDTIEILDLLKKMQKDFDICLTFPSPPPPHEHVAWLGSPRARNFVTVSVTHVDQFVYASVSALSPTPWHRAVPMHPFFFFIVRGHPPSPAPVRFICTIASVTPPGIFSPSLDPRPGTTPRTVKPTSRLLLAATSTATTLASAWPSPSRLKALARVIAILVRVRQLQYFSQSAPTSF